MPKFFVLEYGSLIIEDMDLCMPDGNEYSVHYCKSSGLLSQIQQLILKYSLNEQNVIFFDYDGRSHFIVSVYDEKGEAVFAHLRQKVMLHDIMLQTDCPFTATSVMINYLFGPFGGNIFLQ